MASHYLEYNRRYELSNPSDREKTNRGQNEYDAVKRAEQIALRQNQRILLSNKRAERELLQASSKQTLTDNANLGLVREVSNSPDLATECKLRKSLTFKNPINRETMMSVILIKTDIEDRQQDISLII